MDVTRVFLPADAVRRKVRANLDAIDTALADLRAVSTDEVGNAFRVEMAERLEYQGRVNRGLSYRMLGEVADPPDGIDDPALPTGVRVRELLWQRLRLTPTEIRRRVRLAARLRPKRSLMG